MENEQHFSAVSSAIEIVNDTLYLDKDKRDNKNFPSPCRDCRFFSTIGGRILKCSQDNKPVVAMKIDGCSEFKLAQKKILLPEQTLYGMFPNLKNK